MILRSMDAQNRAQDLSASILSAATPPQIAAACSAVNSFLRKHASDQSRSFFSIAFPSLICRLFGFDSSAAAASSARSSSWIDQAAFDPDLAGKLFNLLSPAGILISSIAAVDRHAIIKYVFPAERLPEWIRFVLQSDKYSSSLAYLCPLFKSRVKDNQIQLNCFEYFVFWFAYYPVCKGNSENAEGEAVRRKRKFTLEQWTIKLPGSKRWRGKQKVCNLYLRLLYVYLNAFVPKGGLGMVQPYRSSLLHYSSSYDCSAFVQAEFLVYALVHFWMVDNDFSPLPVSVCQSFGVSFTLWAVLGETPPTPGLVKVLRLLVQYLNCSLIAPAAAEGNDRAVFAESPVKKVPGLGEFERLRTAIVALESSAASWNAIIQRPLYRFILRSFLFSPMGTSIKNASRVFSLWVTCLRPWKTSLQDFAEFEAPIIKSSDSSRRENGSSERKNNDDRKDGSSREQSVYTPVWESYVALNYLFYSSLVVHFLGFAHKFLHTNVETVVQMVLKVLDILTSSKELMDFLRKVDTAYHSKQSGPFSSYVDNVHKYVPSIREELQDWEDGLCQSDADGSFLHENWNHDLRLFSDGEDGAPKLLQLFVLRAEHEIRATSGDLQNLNSIRSKMSALFGGPTRESYMPTPPVKEFLDVQSDRAEVFTPKHPGVGKRTWADINYKGDWMRRPISDNEVAWLARLLIRLSVWLNEVVGLDRVDITDSAGPTYVDVPHDDTGSIGSPKEALIMVIALIGSWFSLFVQSIVRFMRGHDLRINLRVLASKKVVMVLVVYAVACVLKKALWTATPMPPSS